MHCREEDNQEFCVNCGEPVEEMSSFCSEFCELDYNPNN